MGDYWNEDIVRTSVANQKLNIEGEHPVPFMGSGTTGRVCYKLGRSFVGFYNQIILILTFFFLSLLLFVLLMSISAISACTPT